MNNQPNSKRLVVVRVTPMFFTVEAIFKDQNKYLSENKIEVHVVTSHDPQAENVLNRDGFLHHSINIVRQINLIQDIKSVFLLTRLLNEIKPDIVHTHTSKGGLVGMIAATLAGVKCKIHSVAGWSADKREQLIGGVILICEKITLSLATHIIVNSQSLMDFLVNAKYLTPTKGYLLGKGSSNGVDLLQFSRNEANLSQGKKIRKQLNIPEKGIVIGYVGRIMIEKGVRELVNTFISLDNNIHLIMIGSLENESRNSLLEIITTQIEDNPRIHITGWTNNVPHYLAATDILVHPSQHEGMPNAILQGSAMELPCVASNVRGNQDAVLHKKTGFLYELSDEAQLAKYISLLINDESLRNEFGKQGRKYIEKKFDRNIVCKRLVKFYQNHYSS